jgi:hypothetical protein
MNEQELRAVIRDVVTRQLSAQTESRGWSHGESPWKAHPSHLRLPVASGQDDAGPCLIEPAVRCNHCGYCQSFGH